MPLFPALPEPDVPATSTTTIRRKSIPIRSRCQGVTTAGTNFDCSTIQASGSATVPGNDWTTDFQAIQCYDQLKVNAVLNWISGKTHLGAARAPVPALFGMNFQAVSVGEKLIENGVKGGYTDAAGIRRPNC